MIFRLKRKKLKCFSGPGGSSFYLSSKKYMGQNTKQPKNNKKIGIQNPTAMLKDLTAYNTDCRMPKLMVLNVK